MSGVFNLNHPQDLLAKMARELNRLRVSPDDVDHAFNFFVTAEHMLDWIHPEPERRAQRKALRRDDPLLATVSHLASGAKHFDHLQGLHMSVTKSERRVGAWADGAWAPSMWAPGAWRPTKLWVTLDGEAAEAFGARIDALAMAEKVFRYWSEPGRVPPRDLP